MNAAVSNTFQIYVVSTNATTTNTGSGESIKLTLKSKGWCDAAHQIPAKLDTDCPGTLPTPAATSTAQANT